MSSTSGLTPLASRTITSSCSSPSAIVRSMRDRNSKNSSRCSICARVPCRECRHFPATKLSTKTEWPAKSDSLLAKSLAGSRPNLRWMQIWRWLATRPPTNTTSSRDWLVIPFYSTRQVMCATNPLSTWRYTMLVLCKRVALSRCRTLRWFLSRDSSWIQVPRSQLPSKWFR